jgi:hypothetical protein
MEVLKSSEYEIIKKYQGLDSEGKETQFSVTVMLQLNFQKRTFTLTPFDGQEGFIFKRVSGDRYYALRAKKVAEAILEAIELAEKLLNDGKHETK